MYQTVPYSEIKERLGRLQGVLNQENLEGCIITNNVNLFYLTGTIQMSYLYVPVTGEPILFIRKDYTRGKKESPLTNIVEFKKLEEIIMYLKDNGYNLPQSLAMELASIPAKEYLKLLKLFEEVPVKDCSRILRELRMIKSPFELDLLRESAEKETLVYKAIPRFIRPGITDLELAAAIENLSRNLGHIGLARFFGERQEFFFGQILVGENALVPTGYDTALGGRGLTPAFPKGVTGKTIEAHQPILVDYSANYNGYNVDLTRMFSLGELPQRLKDAYQVSLEIQEEIINLAKPGTSCSELYELALEISKRYNLQDNFMGYYQKAQFVGHGIGLEINELPVLAAKFNTKLQQGMVFAVEPKFAFPGLGAIGIENTFVVRPDGLEKITIVLEELIAI